MIVELQGFPAWAWETFARNVMFAFFDRTEQKLFRENRNELSETAWKPHVKSHGPEISGALDRVFAPGLCKFVVQIQGDRRQESVASRDANYRQ